MYQTPPSDHSSSKGMKVKHLVQLVTLTVLFTWLLYQLNTSHNVKVASLRFRGEEIEDDGGSLSDAINLLDIFTDIDPGRVGDEILSRSLLRQKNIQPAELREIEREENNNGVDEVDQVGDEGDDSGEGDGDGDEDEGAVNFVDQEEHVPRLEEIESEGELKEETAPEGIVTEESERLEQPGRIHSSKSDPTS